VPWLTCSVVNLRAAAQKMGDLVEKRCAARTGRRPASARSRAGGVAPSAKTSSTPASSLRVKSWKTCARSMLPRSPLMGMTCLTLASGTPTSAQGESFPASGGPPFPIEAETATRQPRHPGPSTMHRPIHCAAEELVPCKV
jgi:hypothetical protein